jgi:hypothetical protein
MGQRGDVLQYGVKIREDLMVPKAHHSVPMLSEPQAPALIGLGLSEMLSSVKFHDKLSLHTTEIYNVRPDRVLSAELHLIDLAITQTTPERALRVGLFAT